MNFIYYFQWSFKNDEILFFLSKSKKKWSFSQKQI